MVALAAVSLTTAVPSAAQDEGPDLRVGVSIGGIGLWGVVFEYRWGDTSLDVNVATFTFKDVSVSVAAKRYFGGGDLQPFVGIGLWGVSGRPEEDPRSAVAVLAIAPIGANWQLADYHAFGASLNVNEGLWIRRSDPVDDTAISRRPIPLPAFYYRYRR